MALGMISESIRALSNVFAQAYRGSFPPRRRPFRSHNELEGKRYPESLISETGLAAPGGRIFKTTGDGVLAEFPGRRRRFGAPACGAVWRGNCPPPRMGDARPVRSEVVRP